MHIIYKSIQIIDNVLKLPFRQGINVAHDRLQNIFNSPN